LLVQPFLSVCGWFKFLGLSFWLLASYILCGESHTNLLASVGSSGETQKNTKKVSFRMSYLETLKVYHETFNS